MNGAEIGNKHRAVIRVLPDQKIGAPAVLVKPADKSHRRLGKKARQAVEHVHAVVGRVDLLLLAAGRNLLVDLLVDRVDGALRLYLQQSHRLFAAVGKLLFDDKASRHLVALVVVLVCVETVELRPQHNRLGECRQDHVEKRVLKGDALVVLLRDVRLDRLKVHPLGDVRLVVRAVGIDDAHDKMQRIGIPQQRRVAPVAPAPFLFCHKFFFLFLDLPLSSALPKRSPLRGENAQK